MRSLLARIFLAFWLIIAITIGVAAITGYTYAERMRAAFENFDAGDTILEASSFLQRGGRTGLEEWLRELPDSTRTAVYVIDERGQDLLGRRVPHPIARAMHRFARRDERFRVPPPDSRTLRPARPLTQLIGPDDRIYTIFVVPNRGQGARWLNEQSRWYFLILAIAVSVAVS